MNSSRVNVPFSVNKAPRRVKVNRGWDGRRERAAREGWPNDHSPKAMPHEEYLEKKRIYAQKYRRMLKARKAGNTNARTSDF